MNEFELFWDNIDAELASVAAKNEIGHKYVVRGDLSDNKPDIRELQLTTWVQTGRPQGNISQGRFPMEVKVFVFATGEPKSDLHQVHIDTMKLAFRLARRLQAFRPITADPNNSGCILQVNQDESYEVVKAEGRAYTVGVVFDAILTVRN